jgi:hypothetical protein
VDGGDVGRPERVAEVEALRGVARVVERDVVRGR